jgi:carbon-monoxide dehydrogenase iron sulfur subunit
VVKKKNLISDRSQCIGCRICEMVCSGTKEGVFDPRASRIRVLETEGGTSKAYACVQCEGEPPCILSCPFHALTRDPEARVIKVNDDKCDACGKCVEACPYGAISMAMGMDREKVIVCDLCPDWEEPRCVTFCPSGALRYSDTLPIPKKIAKRQINISLSCNNCGICVSTCSSKILQVRDGWLAPEDPSKCQVCEHCATNCPIGAIRINRRSNILF